MFNPAKSTKNIKEEFIDYITTALNFPIDGDKDVVNFGKQFREELEKTICKGPYVDINTNFVKGSSTNELIEEGILSPLFKEIEKNKPNEPKYKRTIVPDRPLYFHQEKAIRLLNNKKNIVVTSGTGSGKTECFLFPLINSLFREKEAGTLSKPGVRAILIYPMNALANDQMKRLRNLLMEYPEIRFGVFNGDTPYSGDRRKWYNELHGNEAIEKLRWPLPNEPLTREEMIKNPPHILCTNYAMLEYMLLTPNRGAVYTGSDVKFIVLDEAHSYSGATGMETSLLIRRLIARINKAKSHPQYILTSATLGDEGKAEKDISDFAENLTGEKFGTDAIVFGHREPFILGEDTISVTPSFFEECASNETEDYKGIFAKYHLRYDDKLGSHENLFNVCSCSTYYKTLRTLFTEPVVIETIANWLSLNVNQTVAFLHVCSLCRNNGVALVDLRFHFFVRTLEGFYCCFTGKKEAFLERKEYIQKDSHEDRVFEISICKNCGDIAIVGFIEDENGKTYLKNRESVLHDRIEDEEPMFFHIVKTKLDADSPDKGQVDYQEAEEKEAEVEDEEELAQAKQTDATEIKGTDDYYLCPHCGEISLKDDGYPTCKHPKDDYLLVRAYSKKVRHSRDRCLYCFNGEYNKFYIGTESATSVLATALFEELPTKPVSVEVESPLPNTPPQEDIKIAGKQFLAFSDSRAEAAYFASYLDKRYQNLMAKRLFVKLLEDNKKVLLDEDYNDEIWTLNVFAEKLAKLFHKSRTFIDDLLVEPKLSEHKSLCEENAWLIILKELVTCKRSGSLQSLGFLKYEYLGNSNIIVKYFRQTYFPDLSLSDVKELLDELAMTFAYFGAIIPDSYDLKLETRKEVFFVSGQKGIQKSKSGFSLPNIGNWLPMARENDPNKYYKTYRQELALKAFGDENKTKEANKFLGEYFDYLLKSSNQYHAISIDGTNPWYALPTSAFTIKIPGHQNVKWYKCKKCGRITTINFKNKCLITKCSGDLEEITDIQQYLKDNYYLKFYKYSEDSYLKKMLIKEHTAQLSKHDASEYQNKFEKNNINALSCSTTFEMGVDVGELETVFLRDIPPSTANYAQRAGRAGRSKDSAAFVLSFAKLSSHDFNYYEKPTEMINGEITPPYFKLDNPKIVYRHIFSTCFGYFFNKNEAFFEDSEGSQRPISYFIENGGLDTFLKMINTKDSSLAAVLHESFADLDNEFGISDFSGDWVSDLVGTNGRLTSAVNEYRSVINDFLNDIKAIEDAKGKDWKLISGFREKDMERYKGTSIIDFLVQANIIPKYGFPVDTVELKIGGEHLYDSNIGNKGLRLNRDMTQAISDYAPGSKVIADNKMYTARYISKYWKNGEKDFDKLYIYYCSGCGTLNVSHTNTAVSKKCEGCGVSLNGVVWEEAISPSAGMITDGNKPEEVPLTRPKKVYRSDFYYIEEDQSANKTVLDFNNNQITVISSRKDKIIVTSSKGEPFYVCPKCGYSYGRYDRIRGKDKKIDKVAMGILQGGTKKELTVQVGHNRPNGKHCGGTVFEKKALFHAFNTDIVQIIFNNTSFIDDATATSVLFALIGAIADKLHIERSEISGVIKRDDFSGSINYRFILFDNVPGGAGHVKQLLDNNYLNLAMVINAAYDKSLNCSCDPKSSCYKCLRTYDNQKYHNILSRELVINFLKPYVEAIPKKHISTKIDVNNDTNFPFTSWDPFFKNVSGLLTKKAEKIVSTVILPKKMFGEVVIDGKKLSHRAVVFWPDEGIYIFEAGAESEIKDITIPSDVKFLIGNDELTDSDVYAIKEDK